MLKYLPTALLPRGPFRLSVKCYPAACTANILNLKINSGCLVEFGASSGCTSRVSNWGWQAPCPAPAQFLRFFVPPAQACVRKCSQRRVLLYNPGPRAELRFSQGFDLVPRFRKCFLPRWPSGNVLPGKLFVGNTWAVRTEPAFAIKGKRCSRINTLEVVDTCLDCEVCLEAPEQRTGGERRTSRLVNCKHVHVAWPRGRPSAEVTLFPGGGGLVIYSGAHSVEWGSLDSRPGLSSPGAVVSFGHFCAFHGACPLTFSTLGSL